MSENPVNPVSNAAAPANAAEQAVAGNKVASTGQPSSHTIIHNMDDLRKKAPKVYKAMLRGIAQMIMSQMQNSNDRLVALIKEGERNNS